jgi:hypothetical protein
MSKSSHYMPKGDKDRERWLTNFAAEFALIALTLGFTQAEIDEVKNFAAAYIYVLITEELVLSEYHRQTHYKELLADGAIGTHLAPYPVLPALPAAPAAVTAGIFKSLAKIVQRVKNHPDYDLSIGETLRITAPENVVNYDEVKPKIKKQLAQEDQISIDWVKGDMDGVIVFSGTLKIIPPADATPPADAEPEMDWEELTKITHSPFIDTRLNAAKKPETRYYRMRYFKNDVVVGKTSDVIQIIAEVYKNKAGNETATKLK